MAKIKNFKNPVRLSSKKWISLGGDWHEFAPWWYLYQVPREWKVYAILTEYSKVVSPGHLSSKLFSFSHYCADCVERESSCTPMLRPWHKEVSCSCQLPIPTLSCEIISLSPLEAIRQFLSFSRKSMSPKNSEKFGQSFLLSHLLYFFFIYIQPCQVGVR